MDSNTENLVKSFNATLISDTLSTNSTELNSASLDTVEVAVDTLNLASANFMSAQAEAVFDQLPVFKYLALTLKLSRAFSTWALMKKIAMFLVEPGAVPVEQRQQVLNTLDTSKRTEVIENLLLVIDKLENFSKTSLLGKCWAAYLREEIGLDEFHQMAYGLSLISAHEISNLLRWYASPHSGGAGNAYNFVVAGFGRVDTTMVGTWGGSGPVVITNELGAKFAEIIG